MEIRYFDNAATSWPKPPEVMQAMVAFDRSVGASPGRSGHRLSIDAGRTLMETRDLLARMFSIKDSLRIAFTKNATEGLNIAAFGLLKPGDHVIVSSMEHNSLMRPLRLLERRGVEISVVPCSPSGEIDPGDAVPLIRKNTRAFFFTHASNVTGSIMPVAELGKIAREREIVFCVDAAQTAGAVPIDAEAMNIDILAFTGHKSLYGPQGTGGIYVREGIDDEMEYYMLGGTGSRSEYEEQPDFMPDRFESGTPNAIGIAGLGAGVKFLLGKGIESVSKHELRLTRECINGLSGIDGVTVYGPKADDRRTSVVSFNVNGMSPSDVSMALDEEYRIMSRPGLHCAPSAHRTAGTMPEGTVRFSFGYFNTLEEVRSAVRAVEKIARGDVE